jgi:alpha-L-fucosidase
MYCTSPPTKKLINPLQRSIKIAQFGNPAFLACAVLLFLTIPSCRQPAPLEAVEPLPSQRQLQWHELEFYAFVHFNMNTFTDKEWGFGNEAPSLFNPSELDCRQWAQVCKNAGMKGIILTAKHHDGFCLWPSEFTEHSVKNSQWKNGTGDVVRELSDACREYGLKLGIYLSPWDRNHADYGKPEYITYFRNQLRELLTNYGEVFEVWFDGANGGTGYYGGANEVRKIDNKTYYDWENTRSIVRELQPEAVMFSDAGPDVRWVGNESGWAGKTNWCLQKRDEFYPGYAPNRMHLTNGREDGTHWVPAEVDVSIRPGWYYHASEDHKVKSVKTLVDIYYNSIGRNASFLLNFPVDQRGLIHEKDVEQLNKMVEVIRQDFKTNLAKDARADANPIRGNSAKYGANKAVDGNPYTYWATNDGETSGSVTFDFQKPITFNRFLVQEYIPLGQRVKKFSIEAWVENAWTPIDTQTTIGYKRILRFENVTSQKLRFNVLNAKACPLISNIEVYHAPKLLQPPIIRRGKKGLVTLTPSDSGLEIYFTINGSIPSAESNLYGQPFFLKDKAVVKSMAYDPASGSQSETSNKTFDISKQLWRAVGTNAQEASNIMKAIDDNEQSVWRSESKAELPISLVIDLGETLEIKGFTYLTTQQRYIDGTISHYRFFVSADGRNWAKPVSEGEFSNIGNNPILQTRNFKKVSGRFIRFDALKTIDGQGFVSIAELGIITD